MSGPQNELTSVSKRDDSHWEIFDCDNNIGEKRQTVKIVCMDTSNESNCGTILESGVQHTMVDMPGDCGPGRYAVAISLEPSVDHGHLKKNLVTRGLGSAPLYDFTFDYNSGIFEKRANPSKVLLRIDHSDDPGYWSQIVSAQHSKAKRDFEVETHFDGDHKAWLYHTWHKEKRSMTHEELHARWWSGDVREWWDRQKKVDKDYTGVRHHVVAIGYAECPTLDIDTSASVTVIGNLGSLKSFEESSAWFRTRGRVDASLHFNAKGKLSFHTGEIELFGAHNFGASFRVPGLVIIGYPQCLPKLDFHIIGSLVGDATLQFKADYGVNLAKWDYSMRFPVPKGEDDTPKSESDMTEPKVNNTNTDPTTSQDGGSREVDANG